MIFSEAIDSHLMPIYAMGKELRNLGQYNPEERKQNRRIFRHFFKLLWENHEQSLSKIETTLSNITERKVTEFREDFRKSLTISLDWYLFHEHQNKAGRRNYLEIAALFKQILEKCPISKLPDELLVHIFSFLNKSESTQLSLVSRLWNRCIHDIKWTNRIEQIFFSPWAISHVNLKKLSAEMGQLWTKKENNLKSQTLIKCLLKRLSKLELHESCFAAKTIAETLESQAMTTEDLSSLVNFIRDHALCQPAIKLAFNRSLKSTWVTTTLCSSQMLPSASRETPLTRSCPNPTKAISCAIPISGFKLNFSDAFTWMNVSKEVAQEMSVDPTNTFEKSELVVVFDRGNLAGNHHSLFYAYVSEVFDTKEGIATYGCSLRYSATTQSWADKSYLKPEAIGKIPKTRKMQFTLPRSLLTRSV